jgi:putative transposase
VAPPEHLRRTSNFTETQIVGILREAEAGAAVADLRRKHKISRPTFCLWKKKYGGVGVAELQRLKELERENARLTCMYAGQALELTAINDVLTRKL